MIIFDKDAKTLDIPYGLGNLEVTIISGGTPGVAGVTSLDGRTGALTTKTINGNSILGRGNIVISGGTAGVSSLNGEQGDLSLKTINGNSILGSGNIVISGGSQQFQIIDLTTISEEDRATLYAVLEAKYRTGGQINDEYKFYLRINVYTDQETLYAARAELLFIGINEGAMNFSACLAAPWNWRKVINCYYAFTSTGQLVTYNTETVLIPSYTSELTNNSGFVASSSITTIWTGTQAQYDAITTKDPNTLYIVR